MVAQRARSAGCESIGEALVVAALDALVEEARLEVPVRLGEEEKAGVLRLHATDDLHPVRVAERRAEPVAPGAGCDVVEEEHRHVAAHAVAPTGDVGERRHDRLAEARAEGVQLQHVAPRREVRVAAVGEEPAGCLEPGAGLALAVGGGAVHEVVGLCDDPGMVGRDVVRHPVEDEPEAARGERLAGGGETGVASEPLVDLVVADAVRRADDVLVRRVGQRRGGRLAEGLLLERDRPSALAPAPDAHQPDGVGARQGERVPRLRRRVGERHVALLAARERLEPRPGEDLVDHGLIRPARHRGSVGTMRATERHPTWMRAPHPPRAQEDLAEPSPRSGSCWHDRETPDTHLGAGIGAG